jgi:hypothetical protein
MSRWFESILAYMNKEQRKFKKVIKRRVKGKNHAKKHVEKINAWRRATARRVKANRLAKKLSMK